MAEKMITYFGEPARVACDELCSKAWGINNRPKVQLSDDEDDYEFLADSELPEAPADPGTYEGGQGKPTSAIYFHRKICLSRILRKVPVNSTTQRLLTLSKPTSDSSSANGREYLCVSAISL